MHHFFDIYLEIKTPVVPLVLACAALQWEISASFSGARQKKRFEIFNKKI